MAASIVRCRFCNQHKLLMNYSKRLYSTKYYVLLPEVPPDTEETNTLLRTKHLPAYSEITPDKCLTGTAKLAIEYEAELGQLIDRVKDPNFKKTFSSVLEPIEKVNVPVTYAWQTAKNLNYVHGTDQYKEIFYRLYRQVDSAKGERWINQPLHKAVKEVNADRANLSVPQSALVDMYLKEARLTGIELSDRIRTNFINILNKLSKERNDFRSKTHMSTNLFSQDVMDPKYVRDMPHDALTSMAINRNRPDRGPWKVTLHPHVYFPFLSHCPDRMMRWNVWNAFNSRSTDVRPEVNLTNHLIIKEIRLYRKKLANYLGYENFADMSMETKMAGSIENVMKMIESYKNHFKPIADEEIGQLQEFAGTMGLSASLEHWDIPYYRMQHKKQLYNLDESLIPQYLPFPTVLQRLFKLCTHLFAIDFTEVTRTTDVWDKDVQVYDITDTQSGQYLATCYVDPYARPYKLNKIFMESGRERSDIVGVTPVSYLNLNLPRPLVAHKPALMTMSDVSSLFHEFGHGLQQMLTTVPYSELAGQKNIQWDAVFVVAKFMKRLCYHPSILKQITCHHETGAAMPDEMLDKILQSSKHMVSIDILKQLYLSAFDMEMYISEEYWAGVMRRLWPQFMTLPHHTDDMHPCSFTEIFSDHAPASYYSYKWAEMVAADVYSIFDEAGLDNKAQVTAVGKRFRETFLSLGGSVPTQEVFRQFSGRDVSMDTYLRKDCYGLMAPTHSTFGSDVS